METLFLLLLTIIIVILFAHWFFNLSLYQMWIVVAHTLVAISTLLFALSLLMVIMKQATPILYILLMIPFSLLGCLASLIYRYTDWFIQHFG